jgi:diguanylate cyclase (GGDEF)-like protein
MKIGSGAVGTILLVLCAAPLIAQPPEAITAPESGHVSLDSRIELLEDPSGVLSINDILGSNRSFRASGTGVPTFGFSSSVFWARFDTVNRIDETDSWVLVHRYAPMDYVDCYLVADGRVVGVESSGEMVPQSERRLPGPTAQFILELEPEIRYAIYLRFSTESTMEIPLELWERESFLSRRSRDQLVVGVFFGIMFIMILYNLVIFASTRELSYLYYVLFVAAHAFFQGCLLGYAPLYLWPDGTAWTNHALVIFASAALAFAALFTREFLHAKELLPRFSVVIDTCLALSIANAVASPLLSYAIAIQITNASLIAYSAIFSTAGIVSLRKGYQPARFYLIAWASLLVAVIVLALKNYGVLASNLLTNNVLQVGSVLEVVLLSLAMTDRINLLRLEKTRAEHELFLSQQVVLRATEAKLYFDNLTGLPNRNRLISDLGSFDSPHLYLLNVDQFRHVNDFYGSHVGDEVLLELKKRIESFDSGQKSKLFKLDADEYALVLEGSIPNERCLELGRELHDICQKAPYPVKDRFVHLNVSIGISNRGDALLEQADMALNEARRSHPSVNLYDESMRTKQEYENNLKWVAILRDALARDAVLPYFQPIVENGTNRIAKHECLMRIRDSEERIINPGSFIEIAKASKLYPELSRRMIAKSFALLDRSPLDFSVNLSIEDILSPETVEVVESCLDGFRRTEAVVFEITESAGIDRYDLVAAFITKMKDRGCKIAIDDFGSGYSNFERILRLNIDYLKLDASLIRNLDTDRIAKSIVGPIVGITKDLGIETIAEFVHSRAVLDEVVRAGIDFSQGFFVGEPAPDPRLTVVEESKIP